MSLCSGAYPGNMSHAGIVVIALDLCGPWRMGSGMKSWEMATVFYVWIAL